MPLDPLFNSVDPSQSSQNGGPLRITVRPNPPANGQSDNRFVSDGIDDWIVPGKPSGGTSYPDDWIVPGKGTGDPYPDDWIVPARSSSANHTQTPPNVQSAAAGTYPANPFAAPVAHSSAAPSNPAQSYWSLFPASLIGAMAWRPPVFPTANPWFSADNLPASAWPTTPPIFPNALGQFPSLGNAPPPAPPIDASRGLFPRMPTSQPVDDFPTGLFPVPRPRTAPGPGDLFPQYSLLRNLAYLDWPPSSIQPAGTDGFPGFGSSGLLPFSSGALPAATYTPASLAFGRGSPNSPKPPGSDSNPLSSFLNALNPIGSASAAEGEGGPLPPGVAEALARALLDAAAAKKLNETQDILKEYHAATQDLYAAAQGKSSPKALARALEASGVQRPEGYEIHHIVAGRLRDADPARKILQKFGIGINDAPNGVFLPANKTTVNIGGEAVHRPLHTKVYMDTVNEALANATTKQQAIDILQGISRALRSGGYP